MAQKSADFIRQQIAHDLAYPDGYCSIWGCQFCLSVEDAKFMAAQARWEESKGK